MSLNAKIIRLNDEITNFIGHEKQLTPTHFLKFIPILSKFEILSQLLVQEEKLKQNSTEYDFLWKQEIKSLPN